MSMSLLDSGQVIKSAFDDANQALKVIQVGAEFQVDLRASDGDSVISVNPFNIHSDTYTTTGNGTTVDVTATLAKSFSIQVSGTGGAASAWNVVVEGSYDGTNFSTIITHVNGTNADKSLVFSGASVYPCRYFRSRCVSLTLGGSATNVVANIIGMN